MPSSRSSGVRCILTSWAAAGLVSATTRPRATTMATRVTVETTRRARFSALEVFAESARRVGTSRASSSRGIDPRLTPSAAPSMPSANSQAPGHFARAEAPPMWQRDPARVPAPPHLAPELFRTRLRAPPPLPRGPRTSRLGQTRESMRRSADSSRGQSAETRRPPPAPGGAPCPRLWSYLGDTLREQLRRFAQEVMPAFWEQALRG